MGRANANPPGTQLPREGQWSLQQTCDALPLIPLVLFDSVVCIMTQKVKLKSTLWPLIQPSVIINSKEGFLSEKNATQPL